MIIKNKLYRDEISDFDYEFYDEELNEEFGLDDSELNGTPSPIAIENFAAINYFNAILGCYINSFLYTKEGFVASYYYKCDDNLTFVINEDIRSIRLHFIKNLKNYLSSELIAILEDENLSLFQAAMLINFHLRKSNKYVICFYRQEELFNIINQENCKYNHEKMVHAGITDIDNLLNNYIGPTYLKYRGYTREFNRVDSNGKILLDQNPNILSDEETYKEYLKVCGNEYTTRVVLNSMSTDCSADMVAWGYKIISGISPDNIRYEDIYQAYLDYQKYFLPGSNENILKK